MVCEFGNKNILCFILQLFQEGKLTGTKVALLKSKYTELHDTLKRYFKKFECFSKCLVMYYLTYSQL